MLVAAGADLDAEDARGLARLSLSLASDHVGGAQLLLNEGAGPNVRVSDCGPALHLVVWDGRADLMELLLAKGAAVNTANA